MVFRPITQASLISMIVALLTSGSSHLVAAEPKLLNAAIRAGDFSSYSKEISTWLEQKAPLTLDEASLVNLLKDLTFLNTLNQRHLIVKTGANKLGAFVKKDTAHQAFLSALMKNTIAMDLYLEGNVPIGLETRKADTYTLDTTALEIWKMILDSDADAQEGICQKMAIAIAILPPGSVNIGAGGAKSPADPVARYTAYKTAHKNKELFSSFDTLTVWEYEKILCSGASDADLSWARTMINTFRPDLRADELVVNSTSLMWRRNAPAPFWVAEGGFNGTFKNVLAGGGKCGPRSSWSTMVCQAFGIPAIGVSQPAHACVGYKSAFPHTAPQPGSSWKIGFGAGWDKSTLEATKGEKLKGPDFLMGIEKRSDAVKFSQVEHLRWYASTLTSADKASAVMKVASAINDSITLHKTDLTASLKAEEAEADPGAVEKSRIGKSTPASKNATTSVPIPTANPVTSRVTKAGVFHIEADSFSQTGGDISWGGQTPHVLIHDSITGGRQIYFQQQMKKQWADYALQIPASGTYEITLTTACINADQILEVCCGTHVIATINIPCTFGEWTRTKPVMLSLESGDQTLRIQTPVSVNAENHKRGVALREFDITVKKQ